MNTKGRFSYMVAAVYLSLCSTIFAQNQQLVVEIPDPNLRRAVRASYLHPSNNRTHNPSPYAHFSRVLTPSEQRNCTTSLA